MSKLNVVTGGDATASSPRSGQPCHIVKLHVDILGLMFEECTFNFPFQPRTHTGCVVQHPLIEIRSYSQVCQSWRNLILASPALWGKVIDLDLFFEMRPTWRMEFLRRTRDAPLWVQGSKYYHEEVLLDVLNQCWSKIERLVIKVPFDTLAREDCKIVGILKRPAPKLQRFQIRDAAPVKGRTNGPKPFKLFEDKAPKLRHFNSPFVISPRSSWSENLYYVTFSDVYSVTEIVAPLEHMKQLGYLTINSVREDRLPAAKFLHNPINISTLRLLKLDVDIVNGSVFMKHIIPVHGCSVSIDLRRSTLLLEQTSELQTELLNYFDIYIGGSTVKGIEIQAKKNTEYNFTAVSFIGTARNTGETYFYFRLPRGYGTLYDQLLFSIRDDQAFKPKFDNIQRFACRVDEKSSDLLSGNLKSMAKQLPSVSYIKANALGLRSLLGSSADAQFHLPLPGLETVELLYDHERTGTFDSVRCNLIKEALRLRKDIKHPVLTLDITTVGIDILEDVTDILKDVEGLKLQFTIPKAGSMDYTCGVGEWKAWVDKMKGLWALHNPK